MKHEPIRKASLASHKPQTAPISNPDDLLGKLTDSRWFVRRTCSWSLQVGPEVTFVGRAQALPKMITRAILTKLSGKQRAV